MSIFTIKKNCEKREQGWIMVLKKNKDNSNPFISFPSVIKKNPALAEY